MTETRPNDPRVSTAALRILARETREKLRPEDEYEEDVPLTRGVMRGVRRDEHERHLRVIKPLAERHGSGDPDLQCEEFAQALTEAFLKKRHAWLTGPSWSGRERYAPHPAITRLALEALVRGREQALDRWRYANLPPKDDPLNGATIY